jgi:hypothetical protein
MKFWNTFPVVLLLAGCVTTFNGYDDPDAIINSDRQMMIAGNGRDSSGDTYVFTGAAFSGVREIATLKKEGHLGLYASLEFTSGRCKLVLAKDDNIITICEGVNDGVIDLSYIDDGTYKLKMVGDGVRKLDLSIVCSRFEFVEYEPPRPWMARKGI